MRTEPYWPLVALTERQKSQYHAAWDVAIKQAGGVNRLATRLSSYAGEYVTHQAIRNWRRSYRVPVQWALVIEDYTDGKVDFFVMVPWLSARFKQKAAA